MHLWELFHILTGTHRSRLIWYQRLRPKHLPKESQGNSMKFKWPSDAMSRHFCQFATSSDASRHQPVGQPWQAMKEALLCPLPAGSAIVRDLRLWHGGTPSGSSFTRFLTVQSQQWDFLFSLDVCFQELHKMRWWIIWTPTTVDYSTRFGGLPQVSCILRKNM